MQIRGNQFCIIDGLILDVVILVDAEYVRDNCAYEQCRNDKADHEGRIQSIGKGGYFFLFHHRSLLIFSKIIAKQIFFEKMEGKNSTDTLKNSKAK